MSVLDMKLKEAITCIEGINQIVCNQAIEKERTVIAHEKDIRQLQKNISVLKVGAKNYEKENARMMFAGFIVGMIIGIVLATIF